MDMASPNGGSGFGSFSRQQKIIMFTVAIGAAVVGLMARYFQRPNRGRVKKGSGEGRPAMIKTNNGAYDSSISGVGSSSLHSTSTTISANLSPRHERGRSSVASSSLTQTTLVSNSVIEAGANLTCTQLGVLGLESLEKSISLWEESLRLLINSEESLAEEDQVNCERTVKLLEDILDAAYNLQRISEGLYLNEGSVIYAESERASYGRLRSVSSVESFMSAEDFLSDDDEIRLSLQSVGVLPNETSGDCVFPLYEAALRLVEAGAVPYRSLKTEMVGCKHGESEYLAKLHCLRGAFSQIVSDVEKRQWISMKGKNVFREILIKADKDPSDFEATYDSMIHWAQEPANWGLTESELKDRGLRALTFYDIVLDFIFLDAFEDLDAPPASVLAVTQNRWLSNSFKETALSTAVWSVLKTKRKWLRYSDGFMAHFYDLSEHIMPTLAWGFLGPPNTIQDLCTFFKDKFLEFLESLFSFDKVHYTTLDDLAVDVMKKMEIMYNDIMKKIEEIPVSD